MSATETQQHHLTHSIELERPIAIPPSNNVGAQRSVCTKLSEFSGQGPSQDPATKQSKEDIRYYFHPIGKKVERPRNSRTWTVSNARELKTASQSITPGAKSSATPGLEVPPKAKERTSGQRNRDIFLAKQKQFKTDNVPGRTDQNGSTALPGFDPTLANESTVSPATPLSPRIMEVIDSSLMPLPLRNKAAAAAAEAAPEYDDRAEKQKHRGTQDIQIKQEYERQENPKANVSYKPDSIYGTLQPLPVRLQRNDGQPRSHSPKRSRHRRQDTPYSPSDIGKIPSQDSQKISSLDSELSDPIGRTSKYASSEALPVPVALEEWAYEQTNIVHEKSVAAQNHAHLASDSASNNGRDRTLKETKSTETRLFQPKKSKSAKEIKENASRRDKTDRFQKTIPSPTSRLASREWQQPCSERDIETLLPTSPEIIRPSMATVRSDMNNNPRSSNIFSDKMVVLEEPKLLRAHSDQTSTMTTKKGKIRNRLLRVYENYSKNVEGLQMVQ